MKTPGFLSLSVLVSMLVTPTAVRSGSTPSFEHQGLSCMSPSTFSVVEAELDAAALSDVRLAHVYFKSSQGRHWYYVDMERVEGASSLRATLPKPLAATERVEYYLFFITSYLESSQSSEYSVEVSDGACGEAASPPSSLTLRATMANQPPVPKGFSPEGISALVTPAGQTIAAETSDSSDHGPRR